MKNNNEEVIIHVPWDPHNELFLSLCKSAPNQLMLQELKGKTAEQLKLDYRKDNPYYYYERFAESKEGYMRIVKQYPSLGKPHEGWTFAFVEGLSLFIDNPEEWYYTSIVKKINWKGHTFETMNSIYSFEFLYEEDHEK